MPATVLALATMLVSAPPAAAADAPRIEKVASPCHIAVDGDCKVERRPEVAAAGDGGNGGNATVNYNFYLGGANAGNGGNGGNVGPAPGAPRKEAPVPGNARPSGAPPAVDLEGTVSYFTWNYDFEPQPGKRTWSRSGTRWNERYPNGKVEKVYNTVVLGTVQGCRGQIVSHTADPSFEVFIPNVGCRSMMAMFRRGKGSWNGMGQMQDVR